jgi:hypothetical protein
MGNCLSVCPSVYFRFWTTLVCGIYTISCWVFFFLVCWRLEIFLFTSTFRTALGPTQPPIQWVPGALSLGLKRPGHEADHSPPSSAKVKECMQLYFHSPICLHGMVLKTQGHLYLYLCLHCYCSFTWRLSQTLSNFSKIIQCAENRYTL